jgi:hypothetical protein
VASYGYPPSAGGSLAQWIPVGSELETDKNSGVASLGAVYLIFPDVAPHQNKTLAALWSVTGVFGAALIGMLRHFLYAD